MRLELIFKSPVDCLTVVVDGNKMLLDIPEVHQMPQPQQPEVGEIPYVALSGPDAKEKLFAMLGKPVEVAEPKRRGRRPKGAVSGLYRFDEWYALYPRKTARINAEKAWASLKPTDELIDTMIAALRMQREQPDWTKDNGAFIPHPATWLNGKRWMDELPAGAAQAETPLLYPGKPWAAFIKKGTMAEVLNLMAQVGVDDADAVEERLEFDGVEQVCDWLWSFKAVSL